MDQVKPLPTVSHVGLRCGNYILYKLLGHGGFAQTYLGRHAYLDTWATVKIPSRQLSAEEVRRFLREARIAARLIHPHIVRVLEFGMKGNLPFLVMDYAPYGTLRQLYPEGVRLPLETVLKYVMQIAKALQYIHSCQYIHRDIKPENILLGRQNQVWLSDFGIAMALYQRQSANAIERFGTAPYIAPEQIRGEPCYASDQYALAIMVYEWLCGTVPFTGSSREIMLQHLNAPVRPLRVHVPTISAEVEYVVHRALEKDPRRRYSSVRDFAVALEQAYKHNKAAVRRPYRRTEKLERIDRKHQATSSPHRMIAPLQQRKPAHADPRAQHIAPPVPRAQRVVDRLREEPSSISRARQTDAPMQLSDVLQSAPRAISNRIPSAPRRAAHRAQSASRNARQRDIKRMALTMACVALALLSVLLFCILRFQP